MRPHRKTRRQAVHLHQEERRQNQSPGFEGLEGDACDVAEEQETLQEEVPSKKPRGDGRIDSQEEVQPHALLEEEERSEERAKAEGNHVQPLDHSKAPSTIPLESGHPAERTERHERKRAHPEMRVCSYEAAPGNNGTGTGAIAEESS